MDIKQVIIVVHSPSGATRLVYGSDGSVVFGSEDSAYSLVCPESKLTIAIRGQKGESLKAIIDGEGNCISGDMGLVSETLEGFLNEKITSIAGVLITPDDHSESEHSDDSDDVDTEIPSFEESYFDSSDDSGDVDSGSYESTGN